MTDSFSISSINIDSLARISSLAFPLSTTNTVASNSISLNSSSSVVTLSNNGQLLSALSSFQSQLAGSLRSSVSTSSTANTSALAQSLVATFNNLQGSANALQNVLGSKVTNEFLTDNDSQFASLSNIGIELQSASATLRLDTDLFAAAVASDPGATKLKLESAAQALLDASSRLELKLVGASLAQINPTLLGSVVDITSSSTGGETSLPLELLQNLSADSVLNNIQLADLDLAAAGLDSNAILTTPEVLQGALSAELPIANNIVFSATTDLAALVSSSAATSASTGQTTANTPPVTPTSVENAMPLTTALATLSTTNTLAETAVANVARPTNGDVVAADLRATTAQMALQNMLSDPSRQMLRNILDPYYAALVSAMRINEMRTLIPVVDPKAFAQDIPAQVLAAQTSRAISHYKGESVGS